MTDVTTIVRRLLGLDLKGSGEQQAELQRMLETFLKDAREKRGEVQQELVQARAEHLVLQRRRKASAEQARKWGKRAEAALRSGNEDTAREHLRRQRSFEEVTADWTAQTEAQQQAVKALQKASRQLAAAIDEAETRMAALLSRHKAAVAAAHVESILQEMGEPSDAHPGYKTAELSVDAEEAWARALAETSAASVEKRLRALEHGEQEEEIERRLQTMREQLRSR
ncbi:PspA/IM30 family protein [bacterium]|nr:PspA/IM30 family protein [bacterium]